MEIWEKNTMEYYSDVKKNGILKFADKWMYLEINILEEVTRPIKTNTT